MAETIESTIDRPPNGRVGTLLGSAVFHFRLFSVPDSDDTSNPLGSGQDTVYDRVEFAYNRLGQVIEKKDQNGTVHEFTFDGLGRQTSDKVTTVGTGIDDAVLRLSTTFEKRGLPEKLTSYDADSGGSVVNEVELVHNDFGQLVTEYQEHEGSVETSTTPKVQYTYPDGSGGHIRLQKMTYPNGRVLRTEYNTGLDDAMNRVSYLADDDNGSVGTHLAAYSYLGAGSIVQVDYTEPQIRYDLAHGIGNDPYDGMDRFGRVVDLLWRNYGTSTDVVRVQHGYDRASNRLWREDPVAASHSKDFDELYSYDGMYQLTAMQRGDLNAGRDGLVSNTKTFAEDWALDATGNWSTYKQDDDGNGTWDLNQSRSHNKANEITQIAAASTHVAHDAAGNMTKIPKPDDWADHFDLTFDAWNRLVRVADGGTTVAVYEYDARMFRIGKLSYESGMAGDIRSFYFNAAWQCLEERVEPSSGSSSSGASTPLTDRQFIWGLRYIDDLILRDRDADSDSETGDLGKDDSGLEERLYSLQDPNWNVVAIGEPDGDIAERYTYTAYGQPEFRAPTFAGRQSSDCGWDYLCTGREYDAETGLYYYRARYYHPELGRFIGRDPIEYEGGSNLYEFVNDSPLTTVDPYGTQATRPLTPQEIAACCSNALAKQPPRAQATTRGWITCCKRQKLWCINLKLLPLPPRPTPSIPITAADFMRTTVRDCAIKHEQEHMRQTVSCDDPQWDQECLPFANRQMTMQYECGAYQREIYCLLESTAKVPTKMDLNQRLRYIQAIKVKAKDYAALANGQYKCNPPVSSARPKPTPRP